MSSETTAELADLVNEWLRIDQVRMDNSNVLLWCFDTKSRTSRTLARSERFQIYGLPDIPKN